MTLRLAAAVVVVCSVACVSTSRAESTAPASGPPATAQVNPRIAAMIDAVRAGRDRTGAMSALGAAVHNDRTLRDDPAVFAAFEACANDKDPEIRGEAARKIGQIWIWGSKPQKPEAIDLAIKLARDPVPQVADNAIYFGLSTVQEKTDEVIRAQLDAATTVKKFDERGMHGRIAWGLKGTSPQRLAALCEPYWAKRDEGDADLKRAWLIYRLYVETTGRQPPQPERFADLEKRVADVDAAHRRAVLAANANLVDDLARGDSAARMKALRQIYATPDLLNALDLEHLDALIAAAADEDDKVRREVANVVGGRWVYTKDASPKALELLMKLARDPEHEVRYAAVYGGLSNVPTKSDDVIRAMIDAALAYGAYENNLYGRIAWCLNYGGKSETDRLAALFAPYLADADPKRAKLAAMLYIAITKEPPPNADRATADLLFAVPFGAPKGDDIDAAALLERFRTLIPADAYSEAFVIDRRSGFAVAKGAPARQRLLDLIKKTPQLSGDNDGGGVNVPFIPTEMLPYLRKQYATRLRSPAAPAEAQNDRRYAETFQELYDHLGRVYPAFKIKEIDWKKVGEELLPKAKAVKDDEAFGKLVLQLVARLEDSHAVVQPGEAPFPQIEFPKYDPGFACLIDDRDRPVVYYVDKDSPAEKAGVKRGMAVVSVNGTPAADAMKAWMDRQRSVAGYSSERYLRYDAAKGFIRQMKSGDIVKLEMEDPAGAKHQFELPATLGIRYQPRLPVPIEGVNDSGTVEAKKLDHGIGYIYVRRIRGELPEMLDAALQQLGDIKGLILDVRGNSGGGFDAPRALRNFDPNDKEEPDRPRYAGPIALLIDERCISAGEGWASWFFANQRARAFGTTTAGASSRKAEYTLSNGLYKVIVPVKAYTGFLDRPIERRGLEPDVPVRCTAADLAAGRDTVLEAAKQWLREQR